MLSWILAVTLTAPDLGAIERAYADCLDYRIVERGALTVELAAAWQAPSAAGRPYLLLQPASGAPVYLRVVEQAPVPGYAPMRTHGWNSNEILVEDPVALRERIADCPFEVIGEPKGLAMNPAVIAMQAIGPAGELVYFTKIPPGKSVFQLGSAQSFVDRSFIVVLGGPDMGAMRRWYGEALGMPTTEPIETTISVLSRAWGLPPDAPFQLGIVRFPSSFLIELDQYPAQALPRPQREGELPPGMALVSFEVADLDEVRAPFLAPPRAIAAAPYDGRRVALLRGPAGELVELVETPRP